MRPRAAWLAITVFGVRSCTLAPTLSASETTPPCVARAELQPASAVVGQQVLWKVQIDSRDDVAEISWVDTPAFANIRTERLPGVPVVPRRVPRRENDPPSRYTTREEQRALFPERPGSLDIASAGLLCKLRNGVILDTPVPPVTLTVLPIPVLDQPEDFTGVVGPLVLQTHVEPNQLALGSTIHVTVSIRGAGNLWDVGDLLSRWNPTADVFPRKAQLELRAGSRLSVQRIFRYDVVPRGPGLFTIPPVRLSYFDPVESRFLIARSPSVEVMVSPRPVPGDRVAEHDSGRPAANRQTPSAPSQAIPALALGFAVAAGLAYWQWQRGPRAGSLAAPIATGDADHDAAERVRALRSALAAHPEAEAAELLETLERSRFDPNTEAPARNEIERALARLGGTTRGRS